MHPLLSILRAAHCRSTHHYFAIDALPLVQTEPGQRLVRILLQHHDRYLTGAKDPDVRFKDFQNHVVHVADGYWGGAPRVAHKWYDRLLQHLVQNELSDAAYAAGVLSHYFTDPIQPLHTGQTEREAVVHRPLEWSITKSYNAIYQHWQNDELRIVFQLGDHSGWLGKAILYSARIAHRQYDTLVSGYRLEEGISNPPDGLTPEAISALAELFGLAITGWARILERAAVEAEAKMPGSLPNAGLTLSTLMATIRVPDRLWLRRIESKLERAALEDLLKEFRETGTLKEHLPAEVDIKIRVAKVHAQERLFRQRRQRALVTDAIDSTALSPTATPAFIADPINVNAVPEANALPFIAATAEEISPQQEAPAHATPVSPVAGDAARLIEQEQAIVQEEPTTIPFERTSNRLAPTDDLVDAPSIGPKTAARFQRFGIKTVGQFLSHEAEYLVEQLATSWITVDIVRQWQAQSRLMCQIDNLRARDVQLLVGAGYCEPEHIVSRTVESLHREILRFAKTSAGTRHRRGADPPTLDDVQSWWEAAAAVPDLGAKRRAA